MNLKEALNVISDNQIALMTWGGMLLPPINHKLKVLDLEVTLETTGTEAVELIDKLPDVEKEILYTLVVDLENMYVGKPTPADARKKEDQHVLLISVSVSVVIIVMVLVDVAYNKTGISGDNLSSIVGEILRFLADAIGPSD